MRNEICTQINLEQAPRVINSYSANKIVKWVHVKTKIAQMQISRDVQNPKQIFKPKFQFQISPINFVN